MGSMINMGAFRKYEQQPDLRRTIKRLDELERELRDNLKKLAELGKQLEEVQP
jgi:hypothetical protein